MDVQQTILAYIKENGPIKALELSRKTNIPESTVFKHLKHLINQERLFVDSESKYYYKSAPATPPPEPKPQDPLKETNASTSNTTPQDLPKDSPKENETIKTKNREEFDQLTEQIIEDNLGWFAKMKFKRIKAFWGWLRSLFKVAGELKIVWRILIIAAVAGLLGWGCYKYVGAWLVHAQNNNTVMGVKDLEQKSEQLSLDKQVLIEEKKQLQDNFKGIQQELEKAQAEKQKLVDQNDRLSQEKEEASRGLIDQARTIKEDQQKINQLKEQVKELETSLKMASAASKVSVGNAVNFVKGLLNPQESESRGVLQYAPSVQDISIHFDENGERTK